MLDLFHEHLACECHKVNCFVDWTLNERPLPEAELRKFLNVKEIVTYFKQSALNAKLPKTLKQEVQTRWDSELLHARIF